MQRGATVRVETRQRIETFVLAGLFTAVFARFVPSMVQNWNERPDASQGWLVVPLALWIVWMRREWIREAAVSTYAPAAAIVVLGAFAAVISARTGLETVGRAALVLTLNALLLFHMGPVVYRRLAFPALFLFLMVPLPITITAAITFPLQLAATTAAGHVISALGIPVQQLGNVLKLPSGSLEVAEACSGLRSAMTFVTVGILFAWATPGLVRRTVAAALSLPFALLTNVMRIVATGLLLERIGPSATYGTIHETVGMAAFVVGLGLYVGSARLLGARWENL